MQQRLDDKTLVDGQIRPEDVTALKALGVTMIVNNRPDGEDPSQPSSAAIESAARAAGLDYLYVPVRGGPTPDQVEAVRAAVEQAKGPVLAFCRSGTRSIVTWSLGQVLAGADRQTLVDQGFQAGYDLSGVLPA